MGEDTINPRSFSTKYSVGFDKTFKEHNFDLHPSEVEHEGQPMKWLSNTIDVRDYIRAKYDPSYKKISMTAHVRGAKVFRNYYSESYSPWDDKFIAIKDLFDYCDNDSHLSDDFSDRRKMDSYKRFSPNTGYNNQWTLTTITSVYKEIQDNCVDRYNLGSWVHRYLVLLGLQTSDVITESGRQDLEDVCQEYERVMNNILHKEDMLYRDTLNNMIVGEWGISNVPEGASHKVAYLFYNIPHFDDDFVETVLSSNGHVRAEYNRIKNEQERR